MQTKRSRFTVSFLSFCCAMLAACSSESQPTDQEYDGIAGAVGPLVAHDFRADGAIELASTLADGDVPGWMAKDSGGSLEGTNAGFDWRVDLDCLETGGNSLEDPSPRDSVSLCVSADGWLELTHYTATLHAEKEWQIRGMQGDMLELEGDCRLDAAATIDTPVTALKHSFELAITGEHDLAVPRADPPTAIGSLHLLVDAERVRTDSNGDQARQLAVEVVVTLDGSGVALIVVDGVATYELDLRTGSVTSP